MIRPLLYASTLLLFSISCKKEIRYEQVNVDLRITEVINDSTIRLAWTALPSDAVKQYRLLRTGRHHDRWRSEYRTDTTVIWQYRDGVMIQESVPLGDKFTYRVEIEMGTGVLRSNELVYERKQGTFYGMVQDVVTDTVRKYAYVIGHWGGKIAQIRYEENLLVKELELPVGVGYCSWAEVGGQPELFVPRHDGWVEIYDGVSLSLKDRLYVGGKIVTSVIYHNNLLFVSTSDDTPLNGVSKPTKVFRRDTKALVERTNGDINTRFLLLPGVGQKTELLGVVNYQPNQNFARLTFDEAGKALSVRIDNSYYGGRQADVLAVSPSGTRFVCGNVGTVYDTSISPKRHLFVHNPNLLQRFFKDLVFNESGSVVYCANEFDTSIEKFDISTGNKLGVTRATLFVSKLFRDGKQLYCIESDQLLRTRETIQSNYRIQKINF